MSDIMYVSKEAFESMKEELHRMKAVDRPAAPGLLQKLVKKVI